MRRILSISLWVLMISVLTTAASAQLTVRMLQPSPVDPEPPWPNYAPITWVDADDPSLALTLDATLVAASSNRQHWVASAVATADGTLVVDLTVQVDYTPTVTTYTAVATRYRNPWGFSPFGPRTFTATFTTNLNNDGTIAYDGPGTLTWFAAYVGGNPLKPGTAGLTTLPQQVVTQDTQVEPGEPNEVPDEEGWTSNGCSGPCSDHWKPCCDVHDACYCKGGDATDRLNCDNDFKECLRGMGMGKIKAGFYHKGVRLFGEKYFNCTDPMGC